MRHNLAKLWAVLLFIGFISLAGGQAIFYQETFDSNVGWTLDGNWNIDMGMMYLFYEPVVENYNMTALSPLITFPPNASEMVISMYVDEYIDQGDPPETFEIAIMVGTTTNVVWSHNSNDAWGVNGGSDLVIPINAYSGQSVRLRFRSFGASTYNFNAWIIYSLTGYMSFTYDLSALSISGPNIASVGSATSYTVNVKNVGQNAVTAGNYTVKLMQEGDIELASVPGIALAPLATNAFTLSWTPAQTGPTFVYGKVVYAADLYLANNQTSNLSVSVMPAGTITVTLGDGMLTLPIPVYMGFEASLSETIFLAGEITSLGTINSIAFYNSFIENLPAKPTKVWLGTTALTDLTGGWIPSSQLSLVFDGNIDYPAGDNIITIPLATPYPYVGGNLVLLVQRPLDTEYYAENNAFYSLDCGTDRGLLVAGDDLDIDPAAPPEGLIHTYLPKTTLFMTPISLGTLQGTVTSGTTPLQGATITAGLLSTTTNASGNYFLQLPVGTYTVSCSYPDYLTSEFPNVNIYTGQATALNFNLHPLSVFYDSFEAYADFATSFAPWTTLDLDLSDTKGHGSFNFPGEMEPMAFMIFAPSQTTPPSTASMGSPHSGSKMATCWSAPLPPVGNGPNNDWLISRTYPALTANAEVSFWARSLTAQYGLERFKVGITSGGTDPADFNYISGQNYIEAPVAWTHFSFQIPSSYSGQNVRAGIHCVSNDAFVFMVDDFALSVNSANDDPFTPVTGTALIGNFPNPFNPETTISYSVKGTNPVTVEVYNLKGQKVRTLVDETKAEGHYQAKWDGTDENGRKVTSGVYFYRMKSGKFTSSRKMILLK